MATIPINTLAYKALNGDIHIIDCTTAEKVEPPKPFIYYGVGPYLGTDAKSTLDLTPMSGYDNPTSDNYGNYTNSDGSVFVFIPKFYYTFNCKPEDQYYQDTLTYTGMTEAQLAQIVTRSPLNYMAIAEGTAFSNEAEANSHGFILHRAFIDGGKEKSGFFIAKYLASRGTNGTSTKALFVKNGQIISLSNSNSDILSSKMPNCSGIDKDAIILSKAINPNLNCASAFMYSALAMQSKFIGTIATNTSQCAWYDPFLFINFPKGCNNNALGDINDSSVTYTAQRNTKPLTGSGTPFAKTTHNGLNSGVCDLNGCIRQVTTSVGWAGSRILDNNYKLTDITTNNVDTQATSLYAEYTKYIPGPSCWGNSSSSSWRKATNGLSRALEGVYPISASAGCSDSGTYEFGQDVCSASAGSSALQCSGTYGIGNWAGMFCRNYIDWSSGNSSNSFRSGGYALN